MIGWEDTDVLVAHSADDGATWTYPRPLNSHAATDGSLDADSLPQVVADGAGNWIAAWVYFDAHPPPPFLSESRVMAARSTDEGATWTDPVPVTDHFRPTSLQLATDGAGHWVLVWIEDAGTFRVMTARSTDNGTTVSPASLLSTDTTWDTVHDEHVVLKTDGLGNWIAAWSTRDITTGPDLARVVVTLSTDNGATWTAPEPLNVEVPAGAREEFFPYVASDGKGRWLAVWSSFEDPLLKARLAEFTVPCGTVATSSRYGPSLSPPRCTRDAGELVDAVYDRVAVGVHRRPGERFFLSSEDMGFQSVIVDDVVHCGGEDVGLGPYGTRAGVPPFLMDVPLYRNLIPQPAHDVTDLIPDHPPGIIFELLDTGGFIYGNTALYLVRDCGLVVDTARTNHWPSGRTRLRWVSHATEVDGLPNDLEIVSGRLSELRADRGLARACRIASVTDATEWLDTVSTPPPQDGDYYLASGNNFCALLGYGYATPGPRDLVAPPPCLP
jgi:hypothetical protein